jgi:hypothetical protein
MERSGKAKKKTEKESETRLQIERTAQHPENTTTN